jgi:hypothetical protein
MSSSNGATGDMADVGWLRKPGSVITASNRFFWILGQPKRPVFYRAIQLFMDVPFLALVATDRPQQVDVPLAAQLFQRAIKVLVKCERK